MKRIVVLGTSGSGKTTLARKLSLKLGIPHHEIDALSWGPNWSEAPREELRARVAGLVAGDAWIIEGHDVKVRDLTWPRADTFIWLDLPLPVVLARAFRRALWRSVTAQPLWAGNRESFRRTFFSRESILLWTWRTHSSRQRDWAALFASELHPEALRIRLKATPHFDLPSSLSRLSTSG